MKECFKHSVGKWSAWLAALALTTIPGLGLGLAVAQPASIKAGAVPEEAANRAVLHSVDATHDRISSVVEGMAKRLDSFFGNERAFEEGNDSFLQFSLDAVTQAHEGLSFDRQLRAKWVLPHTEQRLRFFIDSRLDDLGLRSDPPNPRLVGPANSPTPPSEEVLGLEAEQRLGEWTVLPSLGAKARWTPDPYARVRALRYFPLGAWSTRLLGTASWLDSEGLTLQGAVDFDHALSSDTLFRASTTLTYEESMALNSAGQIFTVFQPAGPDATLAYEVGATADDQSNWRANQYYVQMRYRRLIYKNWAYLEIQPQYAWLRDEDFDGSASLRVRLELNFGRHYR